jgi:antitoxin component of RelBE/YafQ-DinJ toxin-antitoxin module
MWNSIKERIFPFIIAISALSVSASAAVYSVTGLSMLFAGASTAVIIMAASLEVAKLVIASLLYQYWNKLNKILRVYLTIASTVLILITSAGIYGYLSSAYQKTADQTSIVDSRVASLETKKKLYEDTRTGILQEKQSLSELKGTLSKGSTTQYTDRKGNLVVRSNNASIKQIENASKSDDKLSAKLDVVNDSIFSLETKILEVKTKSTAESELGPLKYLSKLTGVDMDRIINWYILVIIFVFDPLAIALVIAANFAFAQLIRRKELPLEEKVKDMRKVVNAYDDLEDEMKEWEEASLTDLRDDIYWEEPKQQKGTPVMVDPKTGKFYYEEPEPVNLDLDSDGVVEAEELQQVFDEADTNDDGYIDEEEAKLSNLDIETTQKLNQLNKQVEGVVDNVKQYYNFNPEELSQINDQIKKIKKLSMELGSLKNKKDDDNTITYF